MEKEKMINNFFIGGFSGILSKTLFAPFERLRIIFQTQINNGSIIGKEFSKYSELIKYIYSKQGIWSFWNGNLINVIRYFPVQATTLSFKDYFRKIFNVNKINDKNKLLKWNLLSGSLASTISIFITYPLCVTRTVIISKMEKGIKPKIFLTLKEIYIKNGIKNSFYKGFLLAAVGSIMYRTLYYGFYDTFKINKSIENNIFFKMILNNFIILLIGIFNYPFETINRNLMLETDNNSKIKKNYIGLTKHIFNNKGIIGFYKGFLANIIRWFSGGLVIIFYD